VAKVVDVSDDDTDDYSPCKFPGNDMVFVSCFSPCSKQMLVTWYVTYAYKYGFILK